MNKGIKNIVDDTNIYDEIIGASILKKSDDKDKIDLVKDKWKGDILLGYNKDISGSMEKYGEVEEVVFGRVDRILRNRSIIKGYQPKGDYYCVVALISQFNVSSNSIYKASNIYKDIQKTIGTKEEGLLNSESTIKKYYKCSKEEGNENSVCYAVAEFPEPFVEDAELREGAVLRFKYYTVTFYTEKELKVLLPSRIKPSEKLLDKIVNGALQDSDTEFSVPLAELSLSSPAKDIYKSMDKIIKLPSSKLIATKFSDLRELAIKHSLVTTGVETVPDKLSKYKKPPVGVLYNRYGETPEYIYGILPSAKGTLRPEDYYRYQYRLAYKEEIKNNEYDYEVPSEKDPSMKYYLKFIKLEEAETYGQLVNKIIWTDYENELIFYYTNEGDLRTMSIQGYQDISKRDILYLGYSSFLDLSAIISNYARTADWYEKDETKKDAERLRELILKLQKDVEKISPLKNMGEVFTREVAEADNFRFATGTVQQFTEKSELLKLIAKFYSLYGTAYENLESRSTTYSITHVVNSNIDISKVQQEVLEEEKNFRLISQDKDGKTPYLPKDIKNFTTTKTLFAQQAIALSVANNQKNTLIDVDMGGGKTCMMVGDILNQMTKGRVKRPLIVCPDNTIAQNKNEIIKNWTDGRINIFVINTDTYSNYFDYDPEKLKEAIEKMPPNTIYMTSYSFLTRDRIKLNAGYTKDRRGNPKIEYVDVFPIPRMLLRDLQFDMVYCDESHYIRNPNSYLSKAVASLSSAPYKRITSGTIIPNNPGDLFAQLRFVDPTVLGREDEFYARYAQEIGQGNKVRVWKPGAQKQIRTLIQSRGGVSIRKSMWRWMLPKLNESTHYVNLPDVLQRRYEDIMADIKAEISSSKELREAANEMALGGEDEKESLALLAKLSKFNSFLAAPTTDTVSDIVIEDGGPKIIKMNEILVKHFAAGVDENKLPKNGKVIVFCQVIDVAKEAFKYLHPSLKEHAVWYHASMDKELHQFKKNPNIWIIIAVEQSVKEGQNLQVANRIIRLDIPWNPGDLDQSYARAFRPGQKKEVNVDLILCNKTMEITKYMRLLSKEYINKKLTSDFEETDSDNTFIPIVMNLDNMGDEQYTNINYMGAYEEMHKKINEYELEETDYYRKKYSDYKESGISNVGSKKDLEGSEIVVTPELRNERIEIDEEGNITRRKAKYKLEDLGDSLDDDEGDDETEEKVSKDEEKDVVDIQNVDGNIHMYFLEQDDVTYLITLYNKTSLKIKSLGFTIDDPSWIKQVKTMGNVKTIKSSLEKAGYITDIDSIIKDKELIRAFRGKQEPTALQKVAKYYRVTSASKKASHTLEIGWVRMEGGTFLTSSENIPGWKKLPKILYRETKNASIAEKYIKKVNDKTPIGNLEELAKEFKIRFKGKVLDFGKILPKAKKTKSVEKQPKVDDKSKIKMGSFTSGQIMVGFFRYALDNKISNSMYKEWLKFTNKDFKNTLNEAKGFTTIKQCIDYIESKQLGKYDRIQREKIVGFYKSVKAKLLKGKLSSTIKYIKSVKTK